MKIFNLNSPVLSALSPAFDRILCWLGLGWGEYSQLSKLLKDCWEGNTTNPDMLEENNCGMFGIVYLSISVRTGRPDKERTGQSFKCFRLILSWAPPSHIVSLAMQFKTFPAYRQDLQWLKPQKAVKEYNTSLPMPLKFHEQQGEVSLWNWRRIS